MSRLQEARRWKGHRLRSSGGIPETRPDRPMRDGPTTRRPPAGLDPPGSVAAFAVATSTLAAFLVGLAISSTKPFRAPAACSADGPAARILSMQEDRHRAKVATKGADRSSSASFQGTSATMLVIGAAKAARHAKEQAARLELARG